MIHSNGMHHLWHREYNYDILYNWRKDPEEKSPIEDPSMLSQVRSQMKWFYDEGRGRYTNPYHYKSAPGDGERYQPDPPTVHQQPESADRAE